jgi:inward rectifier potassium channel
MKRFQTRPTKRKLKEKMRGVPIVRLVDPKGEINIIRLGLENKIMQDSFHSLLRSSWAGLFVAMSGFIIFSNLIFAGAYQLLGQATGASIENAHSFTDFLFFSVQTMATVGYGFMRPLTNAANLLASIEAFFGLLTFAIIAGLVFAKFAKPTAKVMFSKVAVISIRNGRRAIMFRMANERSNQILDVNLKASIMRTEKTQEGETIRSFHDMKLARAHAPIFALSFTAIHYIDEASPLFHQTAESLIDQDIEIVLSFNGVDEIFSQNIYARHSYVLDELRWNENFVDIISVTLEGYRSLDYSKFHLTQSNQISKDRAD